MPESPSAVGGDRRVKGSLGTGAARGEPTPFFVTGEPSDEQREAARRLLLVSYHFPPSGKVGGLRWQKFCGWLASEGWSVDVVTLDPADVEELDRERLGDLPTGVRIFGVARSRVLRGFRRLEDALLSARDLLGRFRDAAGGRRDPGGSPSPAEREPRERWIDVEAIPSRPRSWSDLGRLYNALLRYLEDRTWSRRAGRTARRLARGRPFDALVTSGPPHSSHLTGLDLASRFRDLPWVMDFRDPWSLMPVVQEDVASPIWCALASRDERRCVARASLVVCNTEVLRGEMCDRYPLLDERSATVMNGYDAVEVPDTGPPSRFRVVYAGSIYVDRDPRPFLRASREAIEALSLEPDEIGVEFVGNVFWYGGLPMSAIVDDMGLADYVSLRPTVPRSEALKIMAGASVLLSLPQDVEAAVPSKVFEYMNFPAWILALARPGSATDEVLRPTPARVLDPDDVPGMTRFLERCYGLFETSGRPEPVARAVDLSRESQARKFGELLEGLVAAV